LNRSEGLTDIAEKLQAVFPDLVQLMPLRLLGEGFSSLVVETAGGIVFRIGRNPTATAGHAREIRLLPHLSERHATPIPYPRWHTGPSELFPFGVMGYLKLPGTPLLPGGDIVLVARGVATFLLELHCFPPEEALALGLPGPAEGWAEWETLRAEVLPPLRQTLIRPEYEAVERWWEAFLGDQSLQAYTPLLQHGDLWYENILVDETGQKVMGVLDFENAAVGDLAQDFAALVYLGQSFVNEVIEAYQAAGGRLGENFLHRLGQLWAVREFGGVQFSVRYNDPEELQDSIHKLRKGPILAKLKD
jgi:aminoglycoside 2''-phosphotransferase